MFEKLNQLLKNAYSPYYHFPVACIIVMKDGKEFNGVNVENANGTSICAERNAIATAISHGYKKSDFNEIHLLLSNGEHGWPCFACRQVILEFFDKNAKVISYNKLGEKVSHTVLELCPYPFDSEDLV